MAQYKHAFSQYSMILEEMLTRPSCRDYWFWVSISPSILPPINTAASSTLYIALFSVSDASNEGGYIQNNHRMAKQVDEAQTKSIC